MLSRLEDTTVRNPIFDSNPLKINSVTDSKNTCLRGPNQDRIYQIRYVSVCSFQNKTSNPNGLLIWWRAKAIIDFPHMFNSISPLFWKPQYFFFAFTFPHKVTFVYVLIPNVAKKRNFSDLIYRIFSVAFHPLTVCGCRRWKVSDGTVNII